MATTRDSDVQPVVGASFDEVAAARCEAGGSGSGGAGKRVSKRGSMLTWPLSVVHAVSCLCEGWAGDVVRRAIVRNGPRLASSAPRRSIYNKINCAVPEAAAAASCRLGRHALVFLSMFEHRSF